MIHFHGNPNSDTRSSRCISSAAKDLERLRTVQPLQRVTRNHHMSRWNPDARSQHKDYRVTDPSSGESVIVSRSTAFRRKSENPSLQIEPCAPLLAGEFSSTGDTNAG